MDDEYKGTVSNLGVDVAEALAAVHSIVSRLIADLDLSSERGRYADDLQTISDVIVRINPSI
ncbi:hypothetical protein [Nocardia asiatica]|uniref:hypothetical protein n=1 Tax=Nocardia asiatica TaxID=209252 RepID=UPI00245585A1|nr:hypothetical protein [Nocardia asiatica]